MSYDWEIAVVGTCPACGQGRQWIVREKTTGKMFVSCEECFAQWETPAHRGPQDVLLQEKYGAFAGVRVDELREHSWFWYVTNKGVLEKDG
jgi:hypothetical protein